MKINVLIKTFILYFAAVIFIINSAVCQKWIELSDDPSATFYDIQNEFNDYFKNRDKGRGSGWIQFKRWEYFMEPRVDPSGKLPAPSAAWIECNRYMEHFKKAAKSSAHGYWKPLGPASWVNGSSGYNPGNGRINVITVDPTNSSTIYTGSPSGGLWKSTDGGLKWSNLTDKQPVLGVSGIAIHSSDPNTIYIATGDGDASATYSIGVLKSTDGGITWDTTGLIWSVTQVRKISRLLINPANPLMLLAATSIGIYRTTNGGSNWTQIRPGNFRDMEFKPGDPSTIYASDTDFYKSADTGSTFTLITAGLPSTAKRMAIAVTAANPDYVYVLAAKKSFEGLYRSTDNGINFTQQSNSPNILGYASDGSDSSGQGWYDLAVAVSPTNAGEVYAGGINIWKSTDGGVTWSIKAHWYYTGVGAYVHADIHTLDFYGTTLFTGSDGGIFQSTDGGNSWSDLSSGLQITQFYRIGGLPSDSGKLCGGTQDNGSNIYSSGSWKHVYGADGMECVFNYNNPSTVYTSSQYGGLRRSTDGGSFFSGITGTISEDGAWVTPYVIHPTNPQILYAGFINVWKTNDGGDNWSAISAYDTSAGNLRSLAVAPSNPDYIYAATYKILQRTTDGGTNWTNITTGLPTLSASISYIAVEPANPDKAWVTFSGYSAANKIFMTSDGGTNWVNYSGTLPNLPANCITYEKGSDDGLYIGMDVGIYYRNKSLADWEPFMDSLPNVVVNELEIHYNSSMIRAATYGRGIWESNLHPPTVKPSPAFAADKVSVCEGEQVIFADQSANKPTYWNWSFAGGNPLTSTKKSDTITYSAAGIYNVTLTAGNVNGDSTLSKVNYITVFAKPTKPIITQNNNLFYTSGAGVTIQWYLNGSIITGATDTFLLATQSGSYSVKITNFNGCSSVSDTNIFTGIEDLDLDDKILIYPNPNNGEFNLRIITTKYEFVRKYDPIAIGLRITNILGEIVYNQVISNKQPETSSQKPGTSINLKLQPPGIYNLQVVKNNGIINKHLVVVEKRD